MYSGENNKRHGTAVDVIAAFARVSTVLLPTVSGHAVFAAQRKQIDNNCRYKLLEVDTMLDLGTAASALNILEKIASAWKWLARKFRREPIQQAVAWEPRWDFEVRPIGFTISLVQQIPSVEIRFYAINYLDRPLVLTQLKVTSLQLHGAPLLEHIPLVQEDCPLRAAATHFITCRRNLSDSELRALPKRTGWQTASFALTAKAFYKNREYKYGPVSSMAIDGWVDNGAA